MSALVADASVVVKAILEEAGSDSAGRILSMADPLLAPHILHAECANAIWKRVHRRLMRREHAAAPLADLLALPVRCIGLRQLTPRAMAIALEYGHPIYDCYYLAAAMNSDCPLATADERLYDLAQRVGLGERAILVR